MVNVRPVRILLECILVTSRNEVLAKVIFSEACVILSTGGWGGVCSKFLGGLLQIFGGGVCSKFSGGVSAPNFQGGSAPNFRGGSPIFGIRSTFGRYASYWNAFLFKLNFILSIVSINSAILLQLKFLSRLRLSSLSVRTFKLVDFQFLFPIRSYFIIFSI